MGDEAEMSSKALYEMLRNLDFDLQNSEHWHEKMVF